MMSYFATACGDDTAELRGSATRYAGFDDRCDEVIQCAAR